MFYDIKRNNIAVASVQPKGNQDKRIMGANVVPMHFFLGEHIDFKIGDHVEVYGETYYLNYSQPVKEHSSIKWEYSMTFQAIPFDLIRAKFFGYSTSNILNEPGPTVTVNASGLLDFIIANLSRTQSGWIKGDVDDTETLTLQFNVNDNCMAVLSRGAEVFKTEYWFEGKTIHLTKKGDILATTLEWGQGKGLRGIERVPLDENPPITRLYVYGSTKNLPAGYRSYSKQLKLPIASAPNEYLEQNVDLYGIREEVYVNEEIYPKREGTVTATGAINKITDSALDFNINDQLIPGTSAKIKFITGQLAGYQFEIQQGGYNATTKTITFNDNKDEKALTVPSALLKPAIGDKWILLDVIMPDSYITLSENELLADGTLYHSQNSGSRFNYPITVDPFHFERLGITLKLGAYIPVKSTEFGLDGNLRIVGYSRDLQDPFKYPNVEVSNSLQINPAVIDDSKQREIVRAVHTNKLNDPWRARNNWKTTQELSTILETLRAEMMLTIVDGGAYSSNITVTTEGNEFSTTTGIIQHQEYIENGGLWNVSAFSDTLTDNVPYFAYVKANIGTQNATIVISTTKIGLKDDLSYYHFPFGIISSLIGVNRFFTSLRGYTKSVAGTISTGRLESNDGLNFFDLDTGNFNLGTLLSGLDWGITAAGQLTIKGQIIATDAEFVNLVVQNLRTGKVRITAADNNIRIVDDLERDIVAIDNDVANEGNSVYGSGMRIGRIGEIPASTTSAKGFYIYGADGTELSFIRGDANVNSVGLFTKSSLQVNGVSNLNSINFSGNLSPSIGLTGLTQELDVRVGGDVFWKMRWNKGVLVYAVKIP